MKPARRVLLCALLAIAASNTGVPAHAQTVQQQTGQQQTGQQQPGPAQGRFVFSVFDQQVELPPGDPRRVTVPEVGVGSLIVVDLLPAADTPNPSDIRLEILRRTADENQRPGRSAFESVYLQQGLAPDPVRFPVKTSGRYIVAVRQGENGVPGAAIRFRVQVERPTSASPAKPQPRTLPEDTRIAVGVFSAGLLWTTLLLCGVPIIRAFRSRRRRLEHPWSA